MVWAEIKEFLHFLFCQKSDINWREYFHLSFYTQYVFFTKPKNLMNFICRMKGHPNGVWFYSSGYEPDMHCKDCEEDLG